jgi:hypothetical protein
MSFPRWRTLAGVTLAALGVSTASAQAAATPKPVDMAQNLRVAISPGKSGTARKPKPASIGVTISSPTVEPATTETVSLSLGKGIEFNNRAFPTCTLQTISAVGNLSRCPKGSIVGRGTARAKGFLGTTIVPETLKVTAVNSPGDSLQLYVVGTSPVTISGPITGKLVKASGKYGYKLNVRLPQYLQEVIEGTAWAPLVYFHVDVKATTTVRRGGRAVRVPYVQTVKCPKGGWPFEAAFTFDQGAPFIDGPLTAVSPNSKCS